MARRSAEPPSQAVLTSPMGSDEEESAEVVHSWEKSTFLGQQFAHTCVKTI